MLLYMLPKARITILVVPLISLYVDILRQVQEINIDYLE
jgi:superfamily II DNA helicase RecQ